MSARDCSPSPFNLLVCYNRIMPDNLIAARADQSTNPRGSPSSLASGTQFLHGLLLGADGPIPIRTVAVAPSHLVTAHTQDRQQLRTVLRDATGVVRAAATAAVAAATRRPRNG